MDRRVNLHDERAPKHMSKSENSTSIKTLGEIGLENFAPYLMNRIAGRYNNDLREEMVKHGLTPPQMRALAVLSIRDGILIGDLAVLTVTEQSTLSRALDTLERSGKIKRKTDLEDSRGVRIHMTKLGKLAFVALWPTMAASHERLFSGIEADEQRLFVETLQKILSNIRKHEV